MEQEGEGRHQLPYFCLSQSKAAEASAHVLEACTIHAAIPRTRLMGSGLPGHEGVAASASRDEQGVLTRLGERQPVQQLLVDSGPSAPTTTATSS